MTLAIAPPVVGLYETSSEPLRSSSQPSGPVQAPGLTAWIFNLSSMPLIGCSRYHEDGSCRWMQALEGPTRGVYHSEGSRKAPAQRLLEPRAPRAPLTRGSSDAWFTRLGIGEASRANASPANPNTPFPSRIRARPPAWRRS